ncbi:MAG: tRNA(His) guanylyltransferase Thg1 family protein [Candidatus Riflebacteria bacterium]|nr:tRNA(His) guanylyltransferase Thg1 family protein [Candidatus Riflebacteria bacterium]
MMIRDALGDRMKHNYEEVTKTRLTRRMPVIIRLDGCHFHTVTRGFKKPFDEVMIRTMQDTMKYLGENIQGCVLGYTQSDEITLVLVDYKKHNSSAWFNNEVQKMVSVSASLATYAFNKFFRDRVSQIESDMSEAWNIDPVDQKSLEAYKKVLINCAYFDSRVFNVPREEVTNCVYWRQKDAERNSINSLAQSLFSHKSLQGLKLKDTLTKIEQEGGVVWGELPTTYKRGSCCVKDVQLKLPDGQLVRNDSFISYEGEPGQFYWDGDGYYFYATGKILNANMLMSSPAGKKLEVTEFSKWNIDNEIPRFADAGREYIEKLIFPADEE